MQRLLLHFVDETLTDFRWALYDEAAGNGEIEWQAAEEGALGSVASKNPYPVTILIPQQCVYLTRVELPEKASRQVLAAIEYQIEDQLAQDIDSQHFAIGNASENPVAIAVVSKEIMQRCLALAQSQNLRLSQLIPELYLCPWSGEGVALTEGHDGCLLRYGDYRGLKCNAQALPAMLDLVKRDTDVSTIRFYAGADEATPELDGYTIERHALAENQPGFVDAPVIDLQQREFQLSSAWKALARAWKGAAMLLAALLAVGAYNKAIALHELEAELDSVKQQQFELVKPYLPEAEGPEDNLKKMLIERLQQAQANQQEQGFLQLMLEFTRARAKYPEVQVARIGFQGKRLSFDISSSKLTDIEALLADVRKLGVNARLESLNIKPDESSGRLVMLGESNA